TTEFTPMGLLPVIADGVQVSIPSAGMLISAYAVGVMLGAPVMTLLFARFGKRAALMSLMLIFTVGDDGQQPHRRIRHRHHGVH
ncbi:hypothetical protein OMF39_21375, partial [Bordetella pertussis]